MSEVMTATCLTIDGREVAFEPGWSILQAAEAAGIEIPNLCAYPTLKPFGRCRLCVVEIEGVRGCPSACTTPATPGMTVVTENETLTALRRGALELILTEHPTGCLMCGHQIDCIEHHGCHSRRSGSVTGCRFCPNDEQCELQAMVARIGLTEIDLEVRYRGLPVDRRDPFFDRDYNLCILCARCVRVCDERRGARAIALTWRGPNALVGTAFDRPLLATECQFCGECVDACPTGALSERVNKWVGLAEQATATTCAFCGLGCLVELEVRDRQVIRARPRAQEQLCAVGRFAPVEVALANERLTEPMIRRGGRLVPVGWQEALAAAAAGLRAAGPRAVFASADLPNADLDAISALSVHLRASGRYSDGPRALAESDPPESASAVETAARILTFRTSLRHFQTPVLLAIQRAAANGAQVLAIEPFGGDLARIATLAIGAEPDEEAETATILAHLALHHEAPRGVRRERWQATAIELLAERRSTVIVAGAPCYEQPATAAAIDRLAAVLEATVLPLYSTTNGITAARLRFEPWPPAAETTLSALLSFGRPPLARRPERFWVAHTHLLDDLTATADVILPATVFAEQGGAFGDLYGNRAELFPALEPAGAAESAAEVCAWLRQAVGAPGESPVDEAPPLVAAAVPLPPEARRPAGELLLVIEPSPYRYLGHPLTAQVPGITPLAGEERLWIHPEDALAMRLAGGDRVAVQAGEDRFETEVAVGERAALGTARYLATPGQAPLGRRTAARAVLRRI